MPVLPIVIRDDVVLHDPGVVPSLSVILPPAQIVPVPLMERGRGFTVTVAVAMQPVPIE